MESVDKLRELPVFGAVSVDGDLNATNQRMVCATKEEVLEIADEIEAEIAERYMLLPLDADFERIRVGDVMNTPFGALPIGGIGCNRVWFMVDGRAEYAMCDSVSHVKPRTLENVLEEYYDKRGWDEADNCALNADELTAKYAAEISELLGGDAE